MEDKKDELTLSTPITDLEDRLMVENDPNNIENIIDLFNMNMKKKDLIRANKLSDLQDKVITQMDQRLSHKADEFSNKDLLEYHKVIQDTISKNVVTPDKLPTIQINNQLNIDSSNELNRESKDRVIDAVKSLLNNLETSNNILEDDDEIIDVEEEELQYEFDL